jgi:hypothetical protein
MNGMLIEGSDGWVRQGNQFAHWIFFLGKGDCGLRIHDGEDIAAVDSAQEQAIAFDTHHAVLLVEDQLLAHGDWMRHVITAMLPYSAPWID